MVEILSLLLVGVIAGTLAGLLGVGGGIIIVPSLVWIFHNQLPALMHIAIGTSLATIVITSISSIIAHHRAVLWSIVWQLSPGIIVGAFVGAIIANALPTEILRKFFAIFILLVSAQLALLPPPASHRQLPGKLGLSITGTVIGKMSALVGIGGGSLTVPFLVWCNIPIRNAVATSAACGFPIAVSGMIGFIVTGWHISGPWMSGYIYWPAFIAITPATLLFAPLGAKLAHTLPANSLKKLFAVFLAGVGVNMF
ncbi:membrane protein [Candidatus Thiomargarita nelsonii]|uniref:Probable membrane transporter protein n=1 Tax=Candidatus Thiomargarita nelsonii TaxID=1003181 RepID=A0A0A6P3K4_9GAMM|nr:membrane protein [Candidatus Thiomargarita nelsonii]